MPVTTASGDYDQDMLLDMESAAAWHRQVAAESMIPYWVVSYMQPGYPGMFVARPWTTLAHGSGVNVQPTAYHAVLIAPTLVAIRALLPSGLLCVDRAPHDPWDIVERWMS
jgi:hypothetical protein